MMNAPGTVKAEEGVLAKLKDCSDRGKRIDGHAPGLSGYQLNAYCAAGVASDHECSEAEEALEKAAAGTVDHDPRGNSSQKSGRTYFIMQAALCKPMYVCYG